MPPIGCVHVLTVAMCHERRIVLWYQRAGAPTIGIVALVIERRIVLWYQRAGAPTIGIVALVIDDTMGRIS